MKIAENISYRQASKLRIWIPLKSIDTSRINYSNITRKKKGGSKGFKHMN